MDADMRRALAAGVGEDVQEFSEENADTWLDDDFVVQAAGVDDVSPCGVGEVRDEATGVTIPLSTGLGVS